MTDYQIVFYNGRTLILVPVDFPAISKGQKVSVDAVKLTVEVKEVYIIKGISSYILYFKIIL
jgi:hypothetical protein